jgi:hypothetical protein
LTSSGVRFMFAVTVRSRSATTTTTTCFGGLAVVRTR